MVRTERALAEKNGEDPWMYLKPEAWLRMLCGDSEGVRRLIEIPMRRIDAQPHAAFTRTVCRLSCGYAEIHQGRFEESLPYFLEILSPETTPPGFFLHWHWRMQAQAGVTEARLSAGHLGKAHSAADALLESALSTADPNLRARAWEMKARVARAEKHYRDAREFIEKALAIVDRFEIPLVAWHAHHTASDLCDDEGNSEKAAAHTARARELILKVADSFQSHEPLRASLLAAASQKRVLA
jgi:tetratricopeptide (TPR) repeat protein